MTPTLERLHRDILGLKKDMAEIKTLLIKQGHPEASVKQPQQKVVRDKEGVLADHVIAGIEASRKRKPEEFIKHEDLMRKYHVQ